MEGAMNQETLDSSGLTMLRSHRQTLGQLPETAPVFSRELGVDANVMRRFKRAGIVERWGEAVHRWDTNQRNRPLWVLTDPAVDALDELGDRHGGLTPCCHSGWTNLTDSPYYQCNDCGGRFTKQEILEGD
jgi:hypothetical protein